MKTFYFREQSDTKGTAVCLGDFDGMHKGHRKLFDTAGSLGNWGAFLFEKNSKGEAALLTLDEKLQVLKELGADYAVAADFETELKKKTPEEFVDILQEMGIAAAVVGYDYRFGRDASGDVNLLAELCKNKNITVLVCDAVTVNGEPVKSTRIRELVRKGRIFDANTLSGTPYTISGKVIKGLGNGRKLGYPTANIDFPKEKLLPPDGVYCGMVDGRPAMINIGKNPTFSAEKRTVEAHILDFDGNLYGKTVTAEFYKKLRDEIKFENKEKLTEQLKKDTEMVRKGI